MDIPGVKKRLCLLLLATLAGASSVLAYAPFGWWPLQIGLLALLFAFAWHQSSIKACFLMGWAYGFGWLGCGLHWLFISMHRYGGMPAWLAILALGLLALGLGLFSGLALAGSSWLTQRRSVRALPALLMIFPSIWMLSEWLRGWVFTGFPWLASGYAHALTPLAGFAPILGVYGLGWLCALMAGCVALLPVARWPLYPSTLKIPDLRRVWQGAMQGANHSDTRWYRADLQLRSAPCQTAANPVSSGSMGIGLALLIVAVGAGLRNIDWTHPHGQPISVRLLQGNVPQEMKFELDQLLATMTMYDTMIRQAPADLIATPETAIPVLTHQLPPNYLPSLAQYAQQSQSHLALGVVISDAPGRYTNSVIGLSSPFLSPKHPNQYRYDKHHLVPFGEFIPTGFGWFVDRMHIPLGDFARAPVLQAPYAVKDQWVLPNICYEDLFGEEIAAQLAADYFRGRPQASLLLNVSNIAWFGDSIALPQHLQISQMRALETGRPMLRATNTGMTAIIDAKGHVIAHLPPNARATLDAFVQGYQGTTPYILAGNKTILALSLVLLALACFAPARAKTR